MNEKDYCNRCGKCCSQIVVDFNNKVVYRDGIQPLGDEFEQILIKKYNKGNVTICECKYLKNNLCTNIDKPQICQDFPSFPFAFIPQECGYRGVMFLKSEHVKQRVRKFKEEIIDYEIQIKQGTQNKKELQRLINTRRLYIDKFSQYGSSDW